MVETMLDTQDLILVVVVIVKKATWNIMKVESKRVDQPLKYLGTAYSTGARIVLSGN